MTSRDELRKKAEELHKELFRAYHADGTSGELCNIIMSSLLSVQSAQREEDIMIAEKEAKYVEPDELPFIGRMRVVAAIRAQGEKP